MLTIEQVLSLHERLIEDFGGASEDEKYELVISVASGQADFESILSWTRDKLISND